MHLLIDADGLVYRCGFAVEKTRYLVTYGDQILGEHPNAKEAKLAAEEHPEGGVVWSRKEYEPLQNALHLIDLVVEAFPESSSKSFWLTPSIGNFREQIATRAKYKGNRDFLNRPRYYREITEYLIDKYGAKYADQQEADDELGIGLTDRGDEACAVSFDKDLLQVPGRHYNWVDRATVHVSPKAGTLSFYSQVLSGDPVDNVPGLPGIGPAKAGKILADVVSPYDAWCRCVAKYEEEFGVEGEDYALETARLVYVRRKKGEIWSPPAD